MFTPEELEEMRRADEEIEADFRLTNEDIRRSRELDKSVHFERKDRKQKKIAENQRAYREANREKINGYMREYMRKRRAAARSTV